MIPRNKSIQFFFPYREVSGVPVLFVRMAEYISQHYDVETAVIDYEDGCMAKAVSSESRVKVLKFRDDEPFYVGENTLLVMQSILPYTIKTSLSIHPSTRIIFWTLYYQNLIQTIIPLKRFVDFQTRCAFFHHLVMNFFMKGTRNRIRRMVSTMASKKSILFMDGSTLDFTENRLGVKINNPIFMPVPSGFVSLNQKKLNKKSEMKNEISAVWLGRLCNFKIHILLYTIKKLAEYSAQNQIRINFHVVGDGPEVQKIEVLKLDNEYFSLVKEGVISGEKLDEYLLTKADILFAMGASALEGAKLGIPTVLLDLSHGPVGEGYIFKWIYEAKKYSLGDIICKEHFAKDNTSISTILNDIDKRFDEISCATYDYYVKKHSIASVCDNFVKSIDEASFTFADFEPRVLKKGIVRKIYEFARRYYNKDGLFTTIRNYQN